MTRTTFVTGSGTGVGKTVVVRLLIAQLKASGAHVRALKPVVTGFDAREPGSSDPGLLLHALEEPIDRRRLDEISPWRFSAPLSPDMAAARERRAVPYAQLIELCRRTATEDELLIEGVGGVLVPLDGERLVADWIAAVGAPALLVTGSYLGTISHTLTALEALVARSIAVNGIVVCESEVQPVAAEETALTIERFSGGCPVIVLPRIRALADAPNLIEPLGLGPP